MQQHDKKVNSFREFMGQCRISSTTPTQIQESHTGWDNIDSAYNGKFYVPDSRIGEMYALMAKAIFSDNEMITLAERPRVAGPLRIDFDIKYTIDEQAPPPANERVYGGEFFFDSVIASLTGAIAWHIKMPKETYKRLLYVFEKAEPTPINKDKTEWKDGFHIMMPEIITTSKVQKDIRRHVLSDMEELFTMDGFNIINLQESDEANDKFKYDDVYDNAIYTGAGWMMYGCGKPGKSPYRLTRISEGVPDGIVFDSDNWFNQESPVRERLAVLFQQYHCRYSGIDSGATKFIRHLSIRRHQDNDALPLMPKYLEYLEKKKDEQDKQIEKLQKEDPHLRVLDEDDLEFAIELVEKCLSKTRADNYQEWVKLCWCLHNIHNIEKGDTAHQLKLAFIKFSQQSDRYKDEAEAACEKYWKLSRSEMDTRTKIGMGSLIDWARADNPKEYEDIMFNRRLQRVIDTCCNKYMPPPDGDTTDSDGNPVKTKPKSCNWDDVNWYLVEVLYKRYGHNMVCTTSMTTRVWWEYKNHRWTNITEGLRNYLSVDVHDLFMKCKKQYEQVKKRNENKEDSNSRTRYEDAERLERAAAGIARHTRNITSKNKIFNESSERFAWNYRSHTKDPKHDKAFEELLDLNLYLIGLDNGVYDLKEHAFRPGCCDDMLSLGTGNIWHEPELGWQDPTVKAIQLFLAQVLPDRDTRHYVMILLASFLSGKVSELFHIFVGCGGNGKSKLIDLFTAAMGQTTGGTGYCGNLPTTALTGKRGCSSGPSPEFARLRGMRFVVVQEPETKDRLQPGRLKELTGGDTIQARALHKAPIEFKPQFGMVMASNVLPKVPGDDGGLWRRMRVVRFKSRFRRTPIPDDPTEFPIDEDLTEKLREWRFTFFWMLTRYYKVYVEGDEGAEPILDYGPGEPRAKRGLPKCASVEYETSRYQSQNDPINKFIVDNVNRDLPPLAQKTATVDFDLLWTRYVGWCKQQHSLPDQDELRNAMEHRFDVMQEGAGFRGWRKIALWTETEMHQRAQLSALPEQTVLALEGGGEGAGSGANEDGGPNGGGYCQSQ